jgi:hypothetical protein
MGRSSKIQVSCYKTASLPLHSNIKDLLWDGETWTRQAGSHSILQNTKLPGSKLNQHMLDRVGRTGGLFGNHSNTRQGFSAGCTVTWQPWLQAINKNWRGMGQSLLGGLSGSLGSKKYHSLGSSLLAPKVTQRCEIQDFVISSYVFSIR